jgi:hypothetical protein
MDWLLVGLIGSACGVVAVVGYLIFEDRQPPQRLAFGADDTDVCEKCGGAMSVARRTPHPEYGTAYELQTLGCLACPHTILRSADESGNPHHD